MQGDEDQIDRLIASLEHEKATKAPQATVIDGSKFPPPSPPLQPPGGGGSWDGMEPRIAVLEADMTHVKEHLGKLAEVPADLATLKERTAHLSTKADLSDAITAAVDRIGNRTQRVVGIGAAGLGAITTIITLVVKLTGH